MAERPKWDLPKHLKQIKAGVDRPGYLAARRAELNRSIEKHLASSSFASLLGVALDLDGLGIVEGVTGVAAICQENSDGWMALQTSFAYCTWNIRICIGLFRRGQLKAGWSSLHLNFSARWLAHAIATKKDMFADWCGRMLLENFVTGEGLYDRWPMPFEPFMVHLFARWKSLPIPCSAVAVPPLGVYQELLDAWESELEFASAVVKACDYHAEHSIEGRIAYAEFVRDPHNVFPADILAIKRVRDAEGLSWPAVRHPLLNTPLAQLPSSLPHPQNDVLDRVAAAVRSVFPDVALPPGQE